MTKEKVMPAREVVGAGTEETSVTPIKVEFDGGYGARTKVGFIIISSDATGEMEMVRLAPPGVAVQFTRVPIEEITPEALKAMEPKIEEAARLLQTGNEMDTISLQCTSGSALIGEQRVVDLIQAGAPGVRGTTLLTGVLQALRAVGARRLAVATPYLDTVNEPFKHYLESQGFEVVHIQGMQLDSDRQICSVAPRWAAQFALQADRAEADTIFVSCGGLRMLDVIDDIEAQAGKPVITSNQATMWSILRESGIDDRIPGYGRLFLDY